MFPRIHAQILVKDNRSGSLGPLLRELQVDCRLREPGTIADNR